MERFSLAQAFHAWGTDNHQPLFPLYLFLVPTLRRGNTLFAAPVELGNKSRFFHVRGSIVTSFSTKTILKYHYPASFRAPPGNEIHRFPTRKCERVKTRKKSFQIVFRIFVLSIFRGKIGCSTIEWALRQKIIATSVAYLKRDFQPKNWPPRKGFSGQGLGFSTKNSPTTTIHKQILSL
jgi:hypothetical protein